ncbi:MFS transporter [Humitalea sp. 24SJ18S-53]|uniref:MFS transporter n=1 Tax=Humitalea sp. 24SJ18S-53 TaxID=3422307 RepID=UPI003D67FDD7
MTGAAPPADPLRRILIARGLRDFGDGFSAVLLPAYLIMLGLDPFAIGLVATVALFGSAMMTLGIGLIGARIGQRLLLLAASALMAMTGLAFAATDDLAMVLVVALLGTINPSAGSVSVFTPLEQAVLAHTAPDAERTGIFARYSLVGALAAAAGALAAASPELMERLGLQPLAALRAMFLGYAALGVAAGLIYSALEPEAPASAAGPVSALGPSRGIVYRLAALFSVDSFAGGFAVQSLLALWLFDRFDFSLTSAGLFFFWSGVL